jgi:hypothetical protein
MGVQSFITELLTGALLLIVIIVEFIIMKVSARNRISQLRAERA